MNAHPAQAIVCGEASLSREGIALVEGQVTVRGIPRSTITAIELRRGFLSARPIPQLGLAMGCAWMGLLSARAFVSWAMVRTGPLKAMGLLAILLPFGAWLALDALKRGEYLDVTSEKGSLRISLQGVSQADLVSSLERARSEFGYNIVDRRSH